jgi:hypothetical protein
VDYAAWSLFYRNGGFDPGPSAKEKEPMKPTVGRIVHYTNLGDKDGKYPPEIQAAIVTGLNEDESVALHVFYRTGGFDMPSVSETSAPAGSEAARGRWAWPARS